MLQPTLHWILLFICVLMMIPMQVSSDVHTVGILGLSTNETVDYKMLASHRSSVDTVTITVTYYDDIASQNRSDTITVDPNMVSELTMTLDSNNMTGTRIVQRSVRFKSDQTVDVRVLVTRSGYTEGFLPLKRGMLGRKHYISTFCEFGGYCQFSITVTGKETDVYIKLPEAVSDIVFCIGEATFHTSSVTNFTLGPNESLLVESPQDLTGTHIVTSAKAVVLAGARDMNVNGTISHLVEQLVPFKHWGMNFIVTSMNINAYGDIIQITSSKYNTRIEMSGFPFFELPRPGMTVKRRLGTDMTSTITSNYPIQVLQISGLWYTDSTNIPSTGHTVAPGMTVVIPIEKFDNKYYATCGTERVYASTKVPSKSTVDIYRYSDSTICLDDDDRARVPYSAYNVYSSTSFVTEQVMRVKDKNDEAIGGVLRCMGSGALMPLGVLVEDSDSECSPTGVSPTYLDGTDNDCDGRVDEGHCFENRLVTTHYTIGVSTSFDFHSENIKGASVIKLRVQTCGTATVQLLNEDGGRYLLRLSRAYMVGYSCFPNCKYLDTVDVRSYFQFFTNCTEDVAFYWIRIADGKVCAEMGPNPYIDCSTAWLSTAYPGNFSEMKVGGLMQDANIWIDIDHPDCGQIESDWRCTDAITNCHEYDQGVCSDPQYSTWANQNCRRFCGICIPDGYGRKFLVTNPTGSTEALVTVRNATTQTFKHIAHSTNDGYILEKMSYLYDSNGDLYEVELRFWAEFAVIITDADAAVTVLYSTSSIEKTFVVYPVDTYGTEYTVNIPKNHAYCDAIALEAGTVLVTAQKNSQSTYEALQLHSKSSKSVLTTDGVVFKANRPFALFCGDVSYSWNQMLPQYSLGKHYVIPNVDPYNSFQLDTYVKIVATQDNTVMTHGNYNHTTLGQRGDAASIDVTFEGTKPYRIASNFPVSVALELIETYYSLTTYTILPPASNFMDYPLAHTNDNNFVVYVDSKGLTNEIWDNITANKKIPSNRTFSLSVYYGQSQATGLQKLVVTPTVSVKFPNLAEEFLCHLTDSSVGDGVDNDCDGDQDEDICYPEYGAIREDRDLDGGFGEDCSHKITGVSNLDLPGDPNCAGLPVMPEIERPDEECWAPCSCDCAWVARLVYRQSLSPEELEELDKGVIEGYKEDMAIDKGHLTSTVAKKQSAADNRQSSTTVGCAGIVFAAVVIALVIGADAITLFSYISGRCSRRNQSEPEPESEIEGTESTC